MNIWKRQRLYDRMFYLFSLICVLCALGAFVFIFCSMLIGGWPKLGIDFMSTPSTGSGTSGGILYQVIGTLILILSTVVIVTPFAISLSLLHTLYLNSPNTKRLSSLVLQMLNGTPSILFGILGFIIFVKGLHWDKSWLAGAIILATMILPTVTVSLIERILTIPKGYIDTAKSLGFTTSHLVWKIILPYSWGGLITGIILGLARAAGETAPIMFTAVVFSGATIPDGVFDNPVLALPYHIFNLAQDVFGPQASATAWATAAILTSLVVFLSIVAIPIRQRIHEEAKS